jgi:hypothetical protein
VNYRERTTVLAQDTLAISYANNAEHAMTFLRNNYENKIQTPLMGPL